MKRTNPIGALIRGVLFAFAIALFMPSAANAHGSHVHGSHVHGSHGHCAQYAQLAETYQAKADNYLQQYNATHHYAYYYKYLCYAKKAAYYKKASESCSVLSTTYCNKYKILADKYKACANKYKVHVDKYLDAYNNTQVGWLKKVYYSYYLCFKKKYDYIMGFYNKYNSEYNTCEAQANPKGTLTGRVFNDADDSGDYTNGETGAVGIHITVTDSKNHVQSTISPDGRYVFNDVAAGEAQVVISVLPEHATLIDGSELSFSVNVVASQNNMAQDTGYTLPDAHPLTCPQSYTPLSMTVFTSGSNVSDNLRTKLNIPFTFRTRAISFRNVITSSDSHVNRPFEQFKIVALDPFGDVHSSTQYTRDINNATNQDEHSNLGSLHVNPAVTDILLVHRADPEYGDNIARENPVTFRGLCYRLYNF